MSLVIECDMDLRKSDKFNHTFVSPAERALYRDVAQSYVGEGRIVDAGCFAGGTTTALCEGLTGTFVSPPMVAIDRFVVGDQYIAAHFAQAGMDLRMGESFLPVFLANMAQHLNLVEVRAGDVFSVSRLSDPIEIVSLDIAKTTGINSFLMMQWFPLLVPGQATLIQQDFYAPSQPWLATSMAMLLDFFSISSVKVGESACFRLERPIPTSALRNAASLDWRSREGMNALDRISELIGEPYNRSILIMKAQALRQAGELAKAQLIVEKLFDLEPISEDTKWMQWLGMAAATLHPRMLSSKRLLAQVYDDDGRFRLGEW